MTEQVMTRQAIRSKALDMLQEGIPSERVLIAYERWLRELIAKEIVQYEGYK